MSQAKILIYLQVSSIYLQLRVNSKIMKNLILNFLFLTYSKLMAILSWRDQLLKELSRKVNFCILDLTWKELSDQSKSSRLNAWECQSRWQNVVKCVQWLSVLWIMLWNGCRSSQVRFVEVWSLLTANQTQRQYISSWCRWLHIQMREKNSW